jgi:hypothetical protein
MRIVVLFFEFVAERILASRQNLSRKPHSHCTASFTTRSLCVFPLKGTLYLVGRLAVNTKYSVNNSFMPVPIMADRRQFRTSKRAPQTTAKPTGKDALNRKMSGFDWALNIPAAPPPQRVSYKQRLV